MTCTTRDRPGIFGKPSCRLPIWVLERADVAVAQRVEDVLDLLAGGRDRADVAASASRDPVAQGTDPGMCADAFDRLHRGPPDQPGTLLGDPPPAHVRVGLVVLGSQPGPARQLGSAAEPGHLADLGEEHRTQDRPDAGDLLDRDIARVGAQPVIEPGW